MYEVEVKSAVCLGEGEHVRALEEAARRLLGLGATDMGRMRQVDIYLSHPDRDFSRTDEAFRIRFEEASGAEGLPERRIFLTYKGPKLSERSKARVEHEVSLDPETTVETLKSLLEGLGFGMVMEVKKSRHVLELYGFEVNIDLVDGLGLFVEVERISDDIQGTEDEAIELLTDLGWTEFERRSYLELLIESHDQRTHLR